MSEIVGPIFKKQKRIRRKQRGEKKNRSQWIGLAKLKKKNEISAAKREI